MTRPMSLRLCIALVTSLWLSLCLGLHQPRSSHAASSTQLSNSLQGVWASTRCDPWPGGPFVRREYRFTEKEFSRRFMRFLDAACTGPYVMVRTDGTYRVTGFSTTVPGALDVEFRPTGVFVTPLTTTAADQLNSANGGTAGPCETGAWFVGAEQRVSVTRGCAALQISAVRNLVEYDIARVEGPTIFFGAPPADGFPANTPQRRPIAFSSGVPLIQAPPAPAILLPDAGGDMTQLVRRVRR